MRYTQKIRVRKSKERALTIGNVRGKLARSNIIEENEIFVFCLQMFWGNIHEIWR